MVKYFPYFRDVRRPQLLRGVAQPESKDIYIQVISTDNNKKQIDRGRKDG